MIKKVLFLIFIVFMVNSVNVKANPKIDGTNCEYTDSYLLWSEMSDEDKKIMQSQLCVKLMKKKQLKVQVLICLNLI